MNKHCPQVSIQTDKTILIINYLFTILDKYSPHMCCQHCILKKENIFFFPKSYKCLDMRWTESTDLNETRPSIEILPLYPAIRLQIVLCSAGLHSLPVWWAASLREGKSVCGSAPVGAARESCGPPALHPAILGWRGPQVPWEQSSLWPVKALENISF